MAINLIFGASSKQIPWGNASQIIDADIDKWPIIPDEVRGYYCVIKKGLLVKVHAISKPSCFLKIALLVESPHKDEFDEIFNPLCPLNGLSGRRFANNIVGFLEKWFNNSFINDGKYYFEVKIINPIQYQTSLYHFLNGKIAYNRFGNFSYTSIDHSLRDDVWRFLYQKCGLEADFIRRVQVYSPDYIINCCTGRNCYKQFNANKKIKKIRSKAENLKALTRETLRFNGLIKSGSYLECNHPISWS